MASQDLNRIREIRQAIQFVACVRDPKKDWQRLVYSPVYDRLVTQQDHVQWDADAKLLNLNGLPIEVRTIDEAMTAEAIPDEWGLVVNYTKDDSTGGCGQYVDHYEKIRVGMKPQAFKDKKESWRGIKPGSHPHIIPNINSEQLRLDTLLVSQASCTTGGAATILKPLADGIEGFEIFPGSTLLTTHGVTASDNAPDLVGNFQMGETGANKALKVVFGEKRLPGIMHVTGAADRAAFLAPSKIQLTLTVAAKAEDLDYEKLRALYEAAANDPSFRMMLGLYYPQDGEKKILGTKFKGEGRTAVLIMDPSNIVVAKLGARADDGRAMYNIVLKKILYDNVFGYVGNTLDLISMIVNKAGVLPAPLQPIDKLRLPWVEPVFQIGRRFMIPVTELEKVEKAMEQARETYESSFVA